MNCTRNDDEILGLLTGDIGPIKAAFLRRHISRCSQCRALYEQMQALWSDLSYADSEPVSEDLKRRTADALPALTESVHRTTLMEALMMHRRTAIVSAVLVLLVATGLVAAHIFAPGNLGEGPVNGRSWKYESSFGGQAHFLMPDGKTTAIGKAIGDGDTTKGEVRLWIDKNAYLFKGLGKHEIRDPKTGELYGYVDMGPAPSKEQLEAERQKSTSGVRGRPFGAEGHDKDLGISWEMHGNAGVIVKRFYENQGWFDSAAVSGVERPGAPKVPELIVTTRYGTITRKGFGEHVIPNDGGKPVVKIILEPVPSEK